MSRIMEHNQQRSKSKLSMLRPKSSKLFLLGNNQSPPLPQKKFENQELLNDKANNNNYHNSNNNNNHNNNNLDQNYSISDYDESNHGNCYQSGFSHQDDQFQVSSPSISENSLFGENTITTISTFKNKNYVIKTERNNQNPFKKTQKKVIDESQQKKKKSNVNTLKKKKSKKFEPIISYENNKDSPSPPINPYQIAKLEMSRKLQQQEQQEQQYQQLQNKQRYQQHHRFVTPRNTKLINTDQSPSNIDYNIYEKIQQNIIIETDCAKADSVASTPILDRHFSIISTNSINTTNIDDEISKDFIGSDLVTKSISSNDEESLKEDNNKNDSENDNGTLVFSISFSNESNENQVAPIKMIEEVEEEHDTEVNFITNDNATLAESVQSNETVKGNDNSSPKSLVISEKMNLNQSMISLEDVQEYQGTIAVSINKSANNITSPRLLGRKFSNMKLKKILIDSKKKMSTKKISKEETSSPVSSSGGHSSIATSPIDQVAATPKKLPESPSPETSPTTMIEKPYAEDYSDVIDDYYLEIKENPATTKTTTLTTTTTAAAATTTTNTNNIINKTAISNRNSISSSVYSEMANSFMSKVTRSKQILEESTEYKLPNYYAIDY